MKGYLCRERVTLYNLVIFALILASRLMLLLEQLKFGVLSMLAVPYRYNVVGAKEKRKQLNLQIQQFSFKHRVQCY